MTARQSALELLYEIEYQDVLSSEAVLRLSEQTDLSAEDRRLAVRLVYGVLEQKLRLDYDLQQLSKTKLSKLDPKILILLRMAIYQMQFMDRIPVSAAVNEAVKLAKKKGQHLGGFVNGVLRNYVRTKDGLKLPDRKENESLYLSVIYSHPLWLVAHWVSLFGAEFAEALMKANNETPPLTVRINRLKSDAGNVKAQLAQDGIESELCENNAYALTIHSGQDSMIQNWPAYQTGLLYVQDLASMLVADVVDPKPGERILDLCAAPGSKTTHMAEKMNNQGWISARDVSDKKLEKIKQNAKRLGLEIIHPQAADGLIFDPEASKAYDRVLLDAPCSGLGIIRRKPEIRYKRTMEDVLALTAIQTQLLENASHYVRPGGILVYSTCSVEKDENECRVNAFLETHPEFQLVQTPWSDEDGYIRRYPHMHQTDGFFIAKMTRLETIEVV
jgi:16S rRNA (cytosine967-C5)-methyltransferase